MILLLENPWLVSFCCDDQSPIRQFKDYKRVELYLALGNSVDGFIIIDQVGICCAIMIDAWPNSRTKLQNKVSNWPTNDAFLHMLVSHE